MQRTTVSLPDDLAQALDREARRRHTSASEVTRAALAQHLGLAQVLAVWVSEAPSTTLA
jgi:metal-responsive CopG/Arc/MetJ family transcriptional regulator